MSKRRRKRNASRGSKQRVKKPVTGSSPSMDRELTPTEQREHVEFLWFPKDGDPERQRVPRQVLEQARKQRPNSEPHILFRVVGVRGRQFGFELPDYADVGTVWANLDTWSVKKPRMR
jgi:hypothetical protein